MSRALRYLGGTFAWTWVSFTLFIFAFLILSSLKTDRELFANMWSLPDTLMFKNYAVAWSAMNFGRALANTLAVVGSSTVLILMLAAPAAYVLTRVPMKGANLLTNLFAIGIGIPVHAILIPVVVLIARLKLGNSLVGLSLIYVTIHLPFTIYLLTGFFRSLSTELEEAAAIDGASPFQAFYRVMLPLARPGLITAAVLNGVSLWNEYLLALTLLNNNAKYTLSLNILNMYGAMVYSSNWVGLFAGVVIVVFPIIIVYTWLSSRIIEGLTLGSGK